eukprot:Em0007g1375a
MENGPYLGWQKATYEHLLLVPIYVILGTTYFVVVVFTVLRLVSWKAKWSIVTKLKEADRKTITYMLETFFNMLHHREGIRDLNQKRSAAKNRKPPDVSEPQEDTPGAVAETLPTVHMRKLPLHSSSPGHAIRTESILSSKWAMTILSWYVASVASLALVIFWDVFILEHRNGHVKEGNADCYIRGANGTYILVNFSQTGLRERHETIDCYALALDFPKALAEVAGILFLASNGFTLLMFLLLLIVDGIESRCYRMVMYVVKATVEYLFVGLMIYAFTVRYELRGTAGLNLLIQDYLISFALLLGVTTPWLLLLWASVSWFWKRQRHSNDPRVYHIINACINR